MGTRVDRSRLGRTSGHVQDPTGSSENTRLKHCPFETGRILQWYSISYTSDQIEDRSKLDCCVMCSSKLTHKCVNPESSWRGVWAREGSGRKRSKRQALMQEFIEGASGIAIPCYCSFPFLKFKERLPFFPSVPRRLKNAGLMILRVEFPCEIPPGCF